MNEANLKEEFNPSDWPLDENEIMWLVKYINKILAQPEQEEDKSN